MADNTDDRRDGAFPPEIGAKIAAMGANFNPEVLAATMELYRPLVKRHSAGKVAVTADVAYGPDQRQKLDIYRPDGKRLPVIVYIPGGGFISGDKNADGAFYPNLGVYFAGHGVLTVVANYRLAPAHQWPAGPQDVALAIAWVRAHAESYGGDVNRIVLWGQSAGATHASGYLFDSSFHPDDGAGVKAAILTSGLYRIRGTNLPPNLKAYFGDDERQYEARSPITHVGKSRVPLLLSVAEYDPAFLAIPTFELAQAVTLRDGRSPQFAWRQGHNHVSTVFSIGSGQDDVGEGVRKFLKTFSI